MTYLLHEVLVLQVVGARPLRVRGVQRGAGGAVTQLVDTSVGWKESSTEMIFQLNIPHFTGMMLEDQFWSIKNRHN